MMSLPTEAPARSVPLRPERDLRLRGTMLVLARVVWWIVTLGVIVLDVIGVPAMVAKYATVCLGCDASDGPLSPQQAQTLHHLGISVHQWASYSTAIVIVVSTVYISIGMLIFLRRSNDRMALFASLMLVTFGGAAASGPMHALTFHHPEWWVPTQAANVIGQITFIAFFYLFPSGRFVPRWTVVPTVIWAAAWLLSLPNISALNHIGGMVFNGPLFLPIILSLIVAQVYRYRSVSTPGEKRQTRWAVYGMALTMAFFASILILGNVILPASVTSGLVPTAIANTLTNLSFILIPIAIAFAVQRSGLWDIDILINRTLVYGSLTALLAGVYFGSVVLMQHLAVVLAGPRAADNPLILVLSTLLIAALFQPLRLRLQRTIDRRFYRQKYDAAKTLAGFAATLRGEVELADLEGHLVGVVEETMQPAHVSLWLRPEPRNGGRA